MAAHRWLIRTPQEHLVEVQHAVHAARIRITVDGETVFEQSHGEVLWDAGFRHEMYIDGQRWLMTICGIGIPGTEYNLHSL